MSFKDSAKGAAKALRLDSHHAIERFGVMFAALAFTFVVIFGGASVSATTNTSEKLDSTTLYTPTFSTSKTEQSGAVQGIYVSTDRTRAMVLMKFNDPNGVSGLAKSYQGFLTGSTTEMVEIPLKNDIAGQIVAFGSTGYMAMVLDSTTPFEQQILNLTMRSNSELVYLSSDKRKVRADLKGQTTFSEFDQWRIYFNPGASGATESTTLDSVKFDAGAVYSELVIKDTEALVRASMDEQLGQLRADQARIAEFGTEMRTAHADGVRLIPPAVPEQIEGDSIKGEPALGETESTLELVTDWVSPSGYDFDWRSGSVSEGYLDDLVDEGESYVTFLSDKAAMSKNGEKSGQRVSEMVWELDNGRLLSDYSSSDKAMKHLFTIKAGLSKAYDDYYKHKIEYQVKAYNELLDLDVELRTVRSGTTVNNGEKALFTY